MGANFLVFHSIGLIGEDIEKGPYRQVVFRETESENTCEMLVYKKERPMIWDDIEKLERGGNAAPYRGYITQYQFIDILVFEGESIEMAYERQKKKFQIKAKLSYNEAGQRRLETKGYMTDLTHKGAMEIAWKPVEKQAKYIKFRFYKGKGQFSWTDWYEISEDRNLCLE